MKEQLTQELAPLKDRKLAVMIEEKFQPFIDQVEMWKDTAESIVISDISQKEEMKTAGSLLREVVTYRTNADKIRKELKADSLTYGRCVQGVYNLIESNCKPIEEDLKAKRDYAKRIKEEALKKVVEYRKNELIKIGVNSDLYNLEQMTNDEFETLLETTIEQKKIAEELKKKEEAERIAKEKAEAEEREQIRIENEKLRQEQEKAEAERKRIEAERQAELNRIEAERKAEQQKADAERKALEAKLEAERIERERLEKEKREENAKIERERLQKEIAEAEAKRKAEMAPDRDKLKEYVLNLQKVVKPELKDEKAKDLLNKINQNLGMLIEKINEHIEKL